MGLRNPEAVRASGIAEEIVIATSQNGFRANDRSVITTYTVPGTSIKLTARKGAPGELLIAAAARWHREVEPLVAGTCWGYAERNIRGSSTTLSNHASGTALDLNAPQHPLGTEPSTNFSAAELAAVRRIIDDTRGVLRWGGTYKGRKDGMHLEVADGKTEQDCRNALGWIGGGSAHAPAGPRLLTLTNPYMRGADVAALQRKLGIKDDGIFGNDTDRALKAWQSAHGLVPDGDCGPKTRAAMGL